MTSSLSQWEAAMELKVRLNGEPEFTWTATDEELDRLRETMAELAAAQGNGQSAVELGTGLLGLFAHGKLPPPQDAVQAMGIQRWVTYGILEQEGQTGQPETRICDLLRHSDIICNIIPSGPGEFQLELEGTPRTMGTA
jgi:hypothetical protein